MGELYWQLQRAEVLFLSYDNHDHRELREQLYFYSDDGKEILRGQGWREFEYSYEWCAVYSSSELNLPTMAQNLLWQSYPEVEQNGELYEKLEQMSSKEKIGKCREVLSKYAWFIHINDLRSSTDWDLINQKLLPIMESRKSCIIVTTHDQMFAMHCARKYGDRVINFSDLLKQDSHPRCTTECEDDNYEIDQLVGRENAFSVKDLVTSSVWGIAGVGKSAIVREEYNNKKKAHNHEDYKTFGWVDVPHPFNLEYLCRRLLQDFDTDKEALAIAMLEGQDPIELCYTTLRGSKFLLVFDGLQSKHDWDLIKASLLSQPIRGATVVITREESIAIHCGEPNHYVYNVTSLEAGAALDIFRKVAFKGNRFSELDPETQMVSELLVSKCGGLPQLIVAIGKLVRAHRMDNTYLKIINSDFIGTLETSPNIGLRGLFCWMQSSFDAFSDELKPCIYYMSIFYAGQSIRPRRLLRRWIAEGYSSGGGGTAEENGEKLLYEIMKLSIVYKEQRGWKVNGFFREYIKSRTTEYNLAFALEGHCSPSSRLTGKHLTISKSWDRDEVVFNSIDLSRLRSLTVFGEWKSFLASEKMKLLRVLDLEGADDIDRPCVTDGDLEKICKHLHRLKFLSVRGCQQITRLPDSLGDMKQLQTLDARYTSIVELPPVIVTKLHKLQYVRAGTKTKTSALTPPPPQDDTHGDGGTSAISGAPVAGGASIRMTERKARISCWKLKNQLDLRTRRRVAANGGGAEIGRAVAEGIGRLTNMHTLGVVNVARGKVALIFLKEVKLLTQLRKLGLSGINRENWSNLCEAISGNLHHLESLSLQLMLLKKEDGGSFDFACFDDIRHPPKTLKSLKVLYNKEAYRGARISPAWLKKLPHLLKRSDREVRISSQEDISEMGKEVTDCVLFIKPIEEDLNFDKKSQHTSSDAVFPFASVKIECSGTLSPLKVTFGTLVHIEVKQISVHCCCSSTSGTSAGSSSCNLQIAELKLLIGLEEVTVTGTYADGLKEHLQDQVHNHYCKPALK